MEFHVSFDCWALSWTAYKLEYFYGNISINFTLFNLPCEAEGDDGCKLPEARSQSLLVFKRLKNYIKEF